MSDKQEERDRTDFLCIGHCCHDVKGDGFILGGTASYAAMVAKRLGMHPAILTSTGNDFLFADTFKELKIPLFNKSAANTTVFENTYQAGARQQYLKAKAATINAQDIPRKLYNIPIVLICPIADEIDIDLLSIFKKSLLVVTIQGFLRDWNERGLVRPKDMDWSVLALVDIVILSDEDVNGIDNAIDEITHYVPHVVITHGKEGVTIILNGENYFFPSFPVKETDATGAGDTFAVAYIYQFQKSNNVTSSAIFAHCTASYIVEGQGVENLADIDQILKRMSSYKEKFKIN